MICHVCKKDAVRNEVLGKEFFYCRACKIEVVEWTCEYSGTVTGRFQCVNPNPSSIPKPGATQSGAALHNPSSIMPAGVRVQPRVAFELDKLRIGDELEALIDHPMCAGISKGTIESVLSISFDSNTWVSNRTFMCPMDNVDGKGSILFKRKAKP